MEFRENQAIYIQIAEYVCEQILLKKWNLGEKIVSIRELAILMQVTPNTVQRAYDFLQQKEIITNKRGIGYFTEADALERILTFRREQFKANELPVFFRNMYLLNMDFAEVNTMFEQFIKDNFKNK
ncbi:MAG: GntR family transcriptional regulator [Segetibacter sp.]|nr:GntR family transcriptional regulator [Segetibacter sp.]